MSTERFKNVTSFVINLLNKKTIILLNLVEYRLILARPRRLSIRRYSARFRRIIVNYKVMQATDWLTSNSNLYKDDRIAFNPE